MSNDSTGNDNLKLRLKMIRMLFFLCFFLSQGNYTSAQSEPEKERVFDAFRFYMPEGFRPFYDGQTLALNSNPDISFCSFVFMTTLKGSENPEKNFEDSWNALIAPALAGGSTERKTWKDDRDNWKGFAGSSTAMFDSLKLQLDLHTYTRNDKYVSVMFFFEPDKCETYHKQFLKYLTLSDDASENGPPASNYYVISDPAFLSQEKLTGVWTLEQDDSAGYFKFLEQENFVTFLDDGNFYNALLPYGSFHVDREKLRKDEAINYKWGNYIIDGKEGTITVPSEKKPIPLTILSDTLILVGEYRFVKSNSVSGYRLEGVWSAEFGGLVSNLELNLASRFKDSGIFKSFHDVSPWLFSDEKGGEGKYQIYDHTIHLQYDDGRLRSLSFVNPGYFNLREVNTLLLIGGMPFKKLEGLSVTY